MPYVEIWKSRSAWTDLAQDRHTYVLQSLTRLVRANAERTDDTYGPYLHCIARDCLLIWDVPADRADQLKAEYEKFLTAYFEPLMFGSAEELTAQYYFDRLSERRAGT